MICQLRIPKLSSLSLRMGMGYILHFLNEAKKSEDRKELAIFIHAYHEAREMMKEEGINPLNFDRLYYKICPNIIYLNNSKMKH